MDVKKIETLVQAFLGTVEEQESKGLTLTSLVKYIYLTDVYYARKNEGQTYTGIEWKFHHFGPYSYPLTEAIRSRKIHLINIEKGETRDEGFEFLLIQLSGLGKPTTLDDTGLGISIKLSLKNDIKRFNRNLSGLLHYVYFNTEPMEGAAPGETLAFENCFPRKISEFKPLGTKSLTSSKLKKGKALLASLKVKRDQRKEHIKNFSPPIFDEHYTDVHRLTNKTGDTPSQCSAKLTFEK